MASHNDLGKRGEDIAAQHLIGKGHTILIRNYRFEKSEVDIISRVGDTIVFTEVKTRTSDAFGYPEDAVSSRKQVQLKLAMEQYVLENSITSEPRFDIISIITARGRTDIHHIEDAFYH
ncbi:MAG: YraN family protein [Bacteroidetes bacterium]|nr:YraN family protein [Bacteroidota bacterium]